jgi:cyclopropane fatty-acyl-phospholipid synthase-like methyltransferase
MNSIVYRVMYWLGQTRWDTGKVPPEVVEAFKQGNIPEGPALDLGCGTGTSVIYMAALGRQAIGIDFVPQAIAKARKKAQQAGVSDRTRFFTADVTRLSTMQLPRCAFALDMGCFHGLNSDSQRRYAQGLAEAMIPDGRYMLYALEPKNESGMSFGLTPDQVQTVFAPWFEFDRVEKGAFWDRKSTWFWMKRNQAAATK